MRVQFLVDYRGKLTGENYYTAGAVVAFEPAIAQALVDEGRAAAVPEPTEIAPALPVKPRRKPSSDVTGGGVL